MERTWAYTSLNNLEQNTIDADWLKTATRRMESDDGIVVVNRGFETEWGVIEHLAIKKGVYELSWEEKQRIKKEIFGNKCAIEFYPTESDQIDSEYDHLWVLQKKDAIPFHLGNVSVNKIVKKEVPLNVEDFLVRIAKNLGIKIT